MASDLRLGDGLVNALAIPGVLQPEERFWPFVGLQSGVSLPVACENVRAEPTLNAEILDCADKGALLQDLGEQAEDVGRT